MPLPFYKLYIAAALCVTQEPVYSLGRSLSSRSRTFGCSQSHTAIHSPSLPFNGLHHRNPHNYMDYHSFADAKEMEG